MQELHQQLQETENRLLSFLHKLNERADLLLEGFVAEAPAILAGDTRYEQAYHRFLAATRGQLQTIREKVREARSQQIEALYLQHSGQYYSGGAATSLTEWYHRCLNAITKWEEALYQRETQAIEKAEWKDYEAVFRQLMDGYHREKESIHCKQCGARLQINQVYYYSVYVPCPFCQTQNIFNPGTNARQLEETARKLAEQRSKPLLEEHHLQQQLERELYLQAHELHLTMIHEKNNQVVREKQHAITQLEAQRQEALQKAPKLLEAYHRSVFNEITQLLPDLHEHNERFYNAIRAQYVTHSIIHT